MFVTNELSFCYPTKLMNLFGNVIYMFTHDPRFQRTYVLQEAAAEEIASYPYTTKHEQRYSKPTKRCKSIQW